MIINKVMLSFVAYIFVISCIWRTKAIDLENVYANFDQLYSKLLNLPTSENDNLAENFDAQLDQNLNSTLDAAILYSNIMEMLDVNKIKKTKKAKILNNKNAENLKEITQKLSTATEVSLVNMCNLWKFWRELGDIYVKNNKNQKEINEFAKVRDKIDLNGYECEENITNNRIYIRDLALANFSAILFLLQQKDEQNKWIKIGIADEYNIRKFSEFFDEEKMENETNFAYQLRRLRINYTENIEIILKVKAKIKELIGPFLMSFLEFIRPFELEFECIEDNVLATDYSQILSENREISMVASAKVSVRIVFGRIMLIFGKMYKMWKVLKVKSRKKIEMLWNQKLLLNLNDEIEKNGPNMLTNIYVFYQNLVTIFNDIPAGLAPVDEQIHILSDNEKKLRNFNQKKLMPSAKTFEMAWDDLLEEHANNVIRFNQSINVFSSLLKDSLMLAKGTKSNLHAFFVSNTENGIKIFNKLTNKHPALLSMVREELTDDQIEELQMRNYIKFLNAQSSLLESNQARFILNILPFYQWLKHLRDKQPSSNKKAELDNKLVELEIRLDAIVSEQNVNTITTIEANLMNNVKIFELQQNANDNQPIKQHPVIVSELIKKSQKFREQLGSPSINVVKMATIGIVIEQIPNYKTKNSLALDGQSSNILQDECDEEKENEEDTAKYELRAMENQYRAIMMPENPISAFIMKDMATINAAYFQCQQWLKQIMQIVNEIKSKTNAKIGWVASTVDSNLTKIKFDEKSFVDKAYKIENICEMAHLLAHIYVQKDLKSITKWNEFVIKNGINAFVENLNIMDISDTKELKKSNCRDQRVKDHILSAINGSPICEQIHMRIITKLLNENESFVQFTFDKASQSLITRELGEQQIIFYKTFLSSNIKSFGMWETKMIMQFLMKHLAKIENRLKALQATKTNEIFNTSNNPFDPQNSKKIKTMSNTQVAKHLVAQVEVFTKFSQMFQGNIGPYSQIMTGQVEITAMIKVIEIFVDNLHCVRMICPLLRFAKFLDNITQLPNIKWHTPYDCFSANFDTLFGEQNVLLANVHFNFLQNYLKNCEQSDEIVQILREKDGTILFLNNLVGGHRAIVDLWAVPLVRKKLVNKTYFTNKLRLLEHYRQVLMCGAEISGKKMMQERFAADVFVWQNSLESERSRNEQIIQKMIDDLYLYSRIFYDSRNTEFVMETSHIFKNLVQETNKFMQKISERIFKDKNIENAWQQMLNDAHAQGKLSWIEAGNKYAEPIEAIQALHFVEFKHFLDKQKQDAEEILNGLTQHKIHQANLLEFLTLNDLKKFFELANVKYNAKNFETPINQKAAKKAEKNRRHKENKKIKKQSLANINATTSESNIVCVENQHKIQNEFSIIETKKEENIANNENKNNTSAELKMELIDFSQNSNLHSLNEFRNELLLPEKYEEFIVNDISIGSKLLLDAGAFVYELQNRIKMFEELEKFAYFSKLNVSKIFKKEFEEFLSHYQNMKKIDANLVDRMFVQMYKMLKKYSNNFVTKIEEIPTKNDINRIKMQIHVKNVSLFIIRDQKFGLKWMKYGEEFKNKKLLNLFAVKNFDLNRFGIINKRFERMTQQVSLDVELYEKYLSKNKQTKYISPLFPEISQQIHFYTDSNNEITKIVNYLNEKRTVGKNVNEFNKRITDALSKIHAIVNKWSNGLARVVVTGSFLLGTHTIGSDIDLICIVPGNVLGLQHFFGHKNAICNKNKCMDSGINNNDETLYCQFCENESIKKLVKVMYSSVFLIKFLMDDVEFDITFVAIPNKNELSTELNEKIVENYASTLNFENDEQKKMLRTLSSYRSTFYLATLFQDNQIVDNNLTNFLANKNEHDFWKNDNKNSQNLRYLILIIKLWAKNNYIYANLYGYLNGIMISIMATKVVLLYPNVSLNFLIEKFFVFYTFRPFHLPLQLEKLTAHPKMDPFFATNPNENRMPVFTPIFPEQNVASLITNASVRIIREEMSNALVKLNQKEADKMNLEILLSNSVPFVEKYEMFVLVNCISTNKSSGENFCHFVEGRIRLQIVYDLENIKTKLQLYNKIYHQTCSIPDKFISTSATYCKVWLIGIHLFEEGDETLKNALNRFDFTIKRDYLKYNYPKINAENDEKSKKLNRIFKQEEVEQKFQELNVNLTSIVVKRNEL